MTILLGGLIFILLGGFAALLTGRSSSLAAGFGVGGILIGCILELSPAIQSLINGGVESLRMRWDVPYGSFFVALDPLSAFFLIPILVLSALAGLYGSEYLMAYRDRKSLGVSWFFFNLLVASMVMVVIARNAILFLFAWEVMSLASFFLVTFEDEKGNVRQAGWIYLVATHLGTAFLFVMFILLGKNAGSLDFDQFGKRALLSYSAVSAVFLLAVIGFGTKAGFMPFHVWLPEAHPAAPSHVSALMSGAMIKIGIYGLVRSLTFLGQPPQWWGWALVIIGLTSGIMGVLFALAQHDLKRLLAYHSVENIGIIALGLGIGIIGWSHNWVLITVLGFGGALLHVVNHAFFKGLLFLGAGSVLHSTGTREIDHLGGLLKRMPWTGITFLVGAVAISGLPPLNGFISEFLIYVGAFKGGIFPGVSIAIPALAVIGGLAIIGGLAAACFTKAFGIIFLGEPRSEHAKDAHESGLAMRIPMLILAFACGCIGIFSPFILPLLAPVLKQITGFPQEIISVNLTSPVTLLTYIVVGSIMFIGFLAILVALRRWLLSGRAVQERITWDCGYAQPSVRMQYTASSFAQPLTQLFRFFLRTRDKVSIPDKIFPDNSSLATDTPDICQEGMYSPVFRGVDYVLSKFRWIQHGNIQLYILYIALTLLAILIWKLG